MTDVSVRDLASSALRASPASAFARRLMTPLRRGAPSLVDAASLSIAGAARRPAPPNPDAVLEWLRAMPGHWSGRALARRELAATATSDGEVREHLAMADRYEKLRFAREGEMTPALPRSEVDRWVWRPSSPATNPVDAVHGRRRRAVRAVDQGGDAPRVMPRVVRTDDAC